MGVCRGALGWQWSLGPWADGLQEAYWQKQRTEREEGGSSDWEQWFAAKRKTCLILLKTVTQYSSSSHSRRQTCVFRFVCWHAFGPFIPTALRCVNNLCKKSISGGVKRRQSWWQVRQLPLCWLLVLSAAAFLAFTPQRVLFRYSPFM